MDHPTKPSFYTNVEVDASNFLNQINKYREVYNEKLTITHLVSKALGDTFATVPEINGFIKLGYWQQYEKVNLSTLVAMDGGQQLGFFMIKDIQKKNIKEVLQQTQTKAKRLRSGKDYNFKRLTFLFGYLPSFIMTSLAELISYFSNILLIPLYPLVRNVPQFGI